MWKCQMLSFEMKYGKKKALLIYVTTYRLDTEITVTYVYLQFHLTEQLKMLFVFNK